MQHKQSNARLGSFLGVLALIMVAGVAVLMTRDVPANRHVIEKQLDAKAFLEQKLP